MNKFSKEEISLCKQVAEKGIRFEPNDTWHGAYYVYHQNQVFPWADGEDKPYYKADEFIWLPEISDCLEFLRERKPQMEFELVFGDEWEVIFHWTKTHAGKTPLEACLKAVLAVLEEGK